MHRQERVRGELQPHHPGHAQQAQAQPARQNPLLPVLILRVLPKRAVSLHGYAATPKRKHWCVLHFPPLPPPPTTSHHSSPLIKVQIAATDACGGDTQYHIARVRDRGARPFNTTNVVLAVPPRRRACRTTPPPSSSGPMGVARGAWRWQSARQAWRRLPAHCVCLAREPPTWLQQLRGVTNDCLVVCVDTAVWQLVGCCAMCLPRSLCSGVTSA